MTATMKPYVNWDALLKKLAWLPVDQMSRAFTDHEANNEVLGVKRAEEIMVILEDALPLLSLSPVEQAPQPVAWRSMATAPMDGSDVLIRTKQGAISCKWDSVELEWVAGWLGVSLLHGDATGWMLAPTPTEAPPVESQAVRLKALEEIHQRWLDGYSFNEDSDEDVQLRDLADAALAAEGSAE